MERKKVFFITGTDTDVGKTIVTYVLGALFQEKGYDIGVMKPIQCSGNDAAFLKENLRLKDSPLEINPYYAKEPLSPNLAFSRAKKTIDQKKIISSFKALYKKHDVMLVEGAGGLLVPIKNNYLMSDLAKDLDLEVIIVSRLGLGSINHTLLTIEQARECGLSVKGVIFSDASGKVKGIPEKTNPSIIKKFGNVPILGTIPFLKSKKKSDVLKKCKGKIDIDTILRSSRSKSSKKRLQSLDKKHLWHPFTQMQDWIEEDPLIIDRAEGNYLIDVDGNKYLDGVSSLWVNVHGHKKKQIDDAIKKQIDKLSHSTLLGLANTPSIELAEKLVEITPKGLEKVFYSDSGSTSVEIAIKMAYQYWQNIGEKQKTGIVHLANSYHGDTLGSVSVGGIDLFHKVYRKLIFKTIKLDFPDCYRAPKGKKYPEYAFECLDKFEQMLKKKSQNIAAFIVEPIVQGAAGMIVWPKGILKRMEQLCRKYNVLLIVDEVATGFGRTGKMFACEHENVNPDIMCVAKGITGGYLPLAATLTTNRIYDGFLFNYKEQKTFFHGHTYTGNPLACASAIANIEVFQKERTLKKLQPKIKFLRNELKKLKELEHVGDIRQKGFMVGLELVKNKKTKQPFPWEDRKGVAICKKLKREGIILRPLGNVIVLMPPLSIAQNELRKLILVLKEIL